jgi:hypothetical protein
LAIVYDITELKEACLSLIKSWFGEVPERPHFENMWRLAPSDFCGLLASDQLAVRSEFSLVEIVLEYIKYHQTHGQPKLEEPQCDPVWPNLSIKEQK